MLFVIGMFVWSIAIMVLVTRALLVVPRELAAIRRELAALSYLGASSASSAIPPARPELPTVPFYTRTGPLGRM